MIARACSFIEYDCDSVIVINDWPALYMYMYQPSMIFRIFVDFNACPIFLRVVIELIIHERRSRDWKYYVFMTTSEIKFDHTLQATNILFISCFYIQFDIVVEKKYSVAIILLMGSSETLNDKLSLWFPIHSLKNMM